VSGGGCGERKGREEKERKRVYFSEFNATMSTYSVNRVRSGCEERKERKMKRNTRNTCSADRVWWPLRGEERK
jgi:hypothetical protein